MMDELNTELMRISESCWPEMWDLWAWMFLRSELNNTGNENGCHRHEHFLLRTHHIRVRLVFPPNWRQKSYTRCTALMEDAPNNERTCSQTHTWAIPSVSTCIIHKESRKTRLCLWSHARNSQHVFGDFSPLNNTLCCVYLWSKCERLNLR